MPALRHSFGILLLASLALVRPGDAQSTDPATPAPEAVDVASLDGIITALYASISGPVGEPRQWDQFFQVVHPGARLIPTRCPASGPCTLQILSPEQYRARADSFLVAEGFFERELARKTERYGSIAQAFSSYASFRRGETTPFARGINSIQLFWDGQRWWVMTIFWDSERPGNPLPKDMEGA